LRLSVARNELRADQDWEKAFTKCLYRPFDIRSIYYHEAVIDRSRRGVMCHMFEGKNLGLVTLRINEGGENFVCMATRNIIEKGSLPRSNYSLFPLYLYITPKDTVSTLFATEETIREPNLTPKFIAAVKQKLSLAFVTEGKGDLEITLGPEDVFHYTYAVFHSPTYRTRYAEFLKIDFPRLPLTSDRELFAWLVGLGADLVALHLLEDDYPAASWNQAGGVSPLQHPITTFVEGANGTTMGAFRKSTCYQDGKVYLDTSQRSCSSYFDGVPEDVWNFHIGGYQVCYKWLYDRRGKCAEPGRTLTPDDIAHYQRIVVALKETIRLMEEIDEVIHAYGGWPIQ